MSSCTSLVPNKVVLIFGPTGVGKTELVSHFEEHRVEIISADSRQIYQALNISTAHPSKDILNRIPHHLVGIMAFDQPYTVFDFVRDASLLIKEIIARGNYPLVVGGAAFYLNHLWRGMPQTPIADIKLRTQLQEELEQQGKQYLYKRLKAVDPDYANRISANDAYRIVRGLEVFEQTGIPISKHDLHTPPQEKLEFLVYGLTRQRSNLYDRINTRVDDMYEQGLVEEVRVCWKQGLRLSHNAGRTIGVQEFLSCSEVIDAWNNNRDIPFDISQELLHIIKCNSRHYAKRQLTFFSRFSSVRWIQMDENIENITDVKLYVVNSILDFFEKF